MFLIHVITRLYPFVPVLQIGYLLGVALNRAEIEHLYVDKTKPFVPYIENKQVPVVRGSRFFERHFFLHALEGEAIVSKIFYIHRKVVFRKYPFARGDYAQMYKKIKQA